MRLIRIIVQRLVKKLDQKGDLLFFACSKKDETFYTIYGDAGVIINYLINMCKNDPTFYHIFNEVVNHCLLTMDKKDLENNTLSENKNTENNGDNN